MGARPRQSGFTLIELLVVIVILSLIVTALTAGVRFAGRAWQTEERLMDRQGDLIAVQTVLRQMLISGRNFTGDDGDLHFVGVLPRALDRGGLFDIEIKTDNDRMVMVWRPHFKGTRTDAAQAGDDQTETNLVTDIAHLEFSYFVPDPATGAGSWEPVVTEQSKLPSMIRIMLKLANGRAWTPLVAAPMIDSPPGAGPLAQPGAQPPGAADPQLQPQRQDQATSQ
jgi:prepilin-type N-terminal cleavage/methylation domain-containing protein